MRAARAGLKNATRVIIKLGSTVVTTPEGAVDDAHLRHLAEQIVELTQAGKQVVLVTVRGHSRGAGAVGDHGGEPRPAGPASSRGGGADRTDVALP